MVPMNLEFVKDLWLPNIFIYNLKTYKVMIMTTKVDNVKEDDDNGDAIGAV